LLVVAEVVYLKEKIYKVVMVVQLILQVKKNYMVVEAEVVDLLLIMVEYVL
jgi:hypothetical protein